MIVKRNLTLDQVSIARNKKNGIKFEKKKLKEAFWK